MTVRLSIYEFIALYKAMHDMTDQDKKEFKDCDNIVINIKSNDKSISIRFEGYEKNFEE